MEFSILDIKHSTRHKICGRLKSCYLCNDVDLEPFPPLTPRPYHSIFNMYQLKGLLSQVDPNSPNERGLQRKVQHLMSN